MVINSALRERVVAHASVKPTSALLAAVEEAKRCPENKVWPPFGPREPVAGRGVTFTEANSRGNENSICHETASDLVAICDTNSAVA
jgi:hypothetical protein